MTRRPSLVHRVLMALVQRAAQAPPSPATIAALTTPAPAKAAEPGPADDTPPPPSCRCGARFDARRMCPHCDGAPVGEVRLRPMPGVSVADCLLGCSNCHLKDSICHVCGADCNTPSAARYHQTECYANEARFRRDAA